MAARTCIHPHEHHGRIDLEINRPFAGKLTKLAPFPMKINLDTVADDAQIQILPLIDVIFCILTFFILAAAITTRQQAISVDLPKASTGAVQMRQMLVVSIDAAGQTYIDKNPIDRAQLFTLLKEYREKNPDGLLVLNASQNAFYNDVIQVLDVLRSVGGDKVALATIPAPSVAPNVPAGVAPGQSLPGQNPTQFSPNGIPGMPSVPGTTNPLLPSTYNPLSPDAPVLPSDVLPGANPNPSPASPNPTSPNPTSPNPTSPNPATPSPASVPAPVNP
jgi:biopolymer transport protein ExbD